MDWWFLLFVLTFGVMVFCLSGWQRALDGWRQTLEHGKVGVEGWKTANELNQSLLVLVKEQQEELKKWTTTGTPPPTSTSSPKLRVVKPPEHLN